MPPLSTLTSPQIGALAARNALVILPVGQIEEHGCHLPVGTDAVIAERVVQAAADTLDADFPTLTLPTLWAGYSGRELLNWPGTIRVRTRVFADLVLDVVTSLANMGFAKIIVVNGHGHHPGILEMVAREMADETGVYIAVVDVARLAAEAVQAHRKSAPGGCIHGGEFETSLMLHLGEPVDMTQATDEDVFTFESEFLPKDGFAGGKLAFWSTWGIQRSKTGIYGDPTLASAQFGEIVFRAMVDKLIAFAREYRATPPANWS